MKYMVTGGTGFLGNVVARKLLAQGHQVTIIVRDLEKARALITLGAKAMQGDVTDKDSMRPAMQGVDGVYHIAGWYKVGAHDKRDGERVNVEGTRNVLELMRELRIGRGVYTSTLAVHSDTHGKLVDESYHFGGKHLSEYDRTKAAAHDIARAFIADGLPLVIVMPGLIYGPGDTSSVRTSLRDYLKGKLPILPRQTAACWGHVDDMAAGHLLAMEKGKAGECYQIAGEPHELLAAFQLAQEITGIRAPRGVSPKVMAVMSVLARPFDRLLPESYTSEGLRVLAGVTYLGDNHKARVELGFEARPLHAGLRETLVHEMKFLGMQLPRRA